MKRARRAIIRLSWAALWLAAAGAPALAQCALCKASVTSANDAGLASSINLAVIFLFIPPVTIFCAIFYFAYKHRHALSEGPEGAAEDARHG